MYIEKIAYVSASDYDKLQADLKKKGFEASEHYDNSYDYELWVEVEEEVLNFLENEYLTTEEKELIEKEQVEKIIFY